MSAIKKFFASNRAYRMKMATVVPVMEDVTEPVEKKNPFEEAMKYYDFILQRDWFVDEESLIDFICQAEPEVFDHIFQNMYMYPERVMYTILNMKPFRLDTSKMKLKVVDLTDQDMYDIEEKQMEEARQEFDAAWVEYKNKHGLQRGVSREEEDLDVLHMMLRKEKETLTNYTNKMKKAYVPPSRRGTSVATVDPMQEQLTKKVTTIENEIKALEKKIQELNNNWEETSKNEFAKQYYKV